MRVWGGGDDKVDEKERWWDRLKSMSREWRGKVWETVVV